MLKKIFLSIFILFITNECALSWKLGSTVARGTSTLNIGNGNLNGPNVVDWFKGGRWNLGAANATDIAKLDAEQYLVGTPTGFPFELVMDVGLGSMWPIGTPFRIRWDAGIKFKFQLKDTIGSCVAVNATVTGCAGNNSATITASNGAAGSMTFVFTSIQTPTLSAFTDGVYEHPAGTRMGMYRVSDEARWIAGIASTPEFESAVRGLNARQLRPMGAVQISGSYNGETVWRNRKKFVNFLWRGDIFPPGAIPSAGGSCGQALICNVGNDYTADSSLDVSGGTWIDGDQIIGKIQTTNSAGISTFSVNGRTPKRIVNNQGFVITTASQITTGLGTFSYIALLDSVVYNSGGIVGAAPIEARVQLANRNNLDLWDTYGTMVTDDYVAQQATYKYENLLSSLKSIPEYANEIWNNQFPQANMAYNLGSKLGWVVGSNQARYSYTGLRFKQIVDLERAAFGAQSDRVNGALAYWVADGGLSFGNQPNFQFLGTVLKNSGVTQQGTVSFTIGTPCQIIWSGNGLPAYTDGLQISFTSTGVLPTGIVSAQTYFIQNLTDNNPGTTPFNLSNTINGATIACSGSPTGIVTATYTNTLYALKIGVDYSVKPNRPVDAAYYAAPAAYIQAANICPFLPTSCAGKALSNKTFWQNLITAWETGQVQTALDMIDNDIRQGRLSDATFNVTAVSTIFTTSSPHGFVQNSDVQFSVSGGTSYGGVSMTEVYQITSCNGSCTGATQFTMRPYNQYGVPAGSNVDAGSAGTGTMTVSNMSSRNTLQWSDSAWFLRPFGMVLQFNSDRPAGMPELKSAPYEGAMEFGPINAANCITLSIVANDCAASATAVLDAWQFSSMARQFQLDYYKCLTGQYAGCPRTFSLPNSVMPSNLILTCPNIWTLIPSCVPNAIPYQQYWGTRDFNALP